MIGKTISHYRILEKLGEGGMGMVYKAEDTRLMRAVALKFLPPAMTSDPGARERFIYEARAASALDHPNICNIHEIDESEDGRTFIVMACYEGENLKEMLDRGLPEPDRVLDIIRQVAEGLREAHKKNIVHRDIKPANIVVTTDGLAKIMDFGLAKLKGVSHLTKEGSTIGTTSYMSPEQAQGHEIDHRTDIWSLGVVLYEMLTDRTPYRGEYEPAVIYSIVHEDPEPPSRIRPELPEALDAVILRALSKDPNNRYQSINEFLFDLGRIISPEHEGSPSAGGGGKILWLLRKPLVGIPVILALCMLALLAGNSIRKAREARKARNELLPVIMELMENDRYYAAWETAVGAREILTDDPVLESLWSEMTICAVIVTSPPGAGISIQEYARPDAEWHSIGVTPMDRAFLPQGFFRWKIEKEGFIPLEVGLPSDRDTFEFQLDEAGSLPEGMVRVPGGIGGEWVPGFGRLATPRLPSFLADRYEVTNRQFKSFVDAGGYERGEFWKHPFVVDGSSIPWDEARKMFRDRTGRPGPAGWEMSDYPDGQADHPVSGVSWFEAAAFAEFAGKSLPTLFHWIYIASVRASAHIIPLSNFGRDGIAPVGSHNGTGHFGLDDIAGNVSEWCFNATGKDRYLMGGCWSAPQYQFNFPEKASPFDRSECNGFRCITLLGREEIPEEIWDEITFMFVHDYGSDQPVSAEILDALCSIYQYEKTDLNEHVEFRDETGEDWTIEKISYDAPYRGERMFSYLFLPKGASYPYQTIVLFPGSYAMNMESSENGRNLNTFDFVDFVIKSGRAVLCPAYLSTYERKDGYSLYDPRNTPSDHAQHIIAWRKDLSRSVDYLETRDDIDMGKLAYFGSSWGGWLAPIYLGQDDRFSVAVLRLTGLPTFEMPPTFSPFNFLPRVRIPVLLLNGRYDYTFPYETSQLPFFNNLATGAENKKLVLFETSHSMSGHRNEMIRETLDWLDKYLGPVD